MLKTEHGGDIKKAMRDYGLSAKKLIDFSANINPLGLPDKIKKMLVKNIDSLVHYPQPRSENLKIQLALFHGLKPANLLIGNGSIELIYLIPQALKAKKILIITPAFSEYEAAARLSAAEVVFLKTSEQHNFKIDASKLKKFIPKINLLFLCNPNNPTGNLVAPDEMHFLLKACEKHKVFLAVDEAFMDFAEEGERLTLVKEALRSKYLLVLRSLTKFFAFAGLRLGYLAGHCAAIGRLSLFQYPWNVNSLAQAAAAEFIKDKNYIRASRKFIREEREYLSDSLCRIKGIKVYPANANFIFCKIENKKIITTSGLYERLARKGIIIRDCGNFRGLNDKFFRVAVRTRKDNIRLIGGIKESLE